jgi:hypothetical protein
MGKYGFQTNVQIGFFIIWRERRLFKGVLNRRTHAVLEPKLDKLWDLTENNIGEIDNQLVNFNSSD